jgi:hypothetical protein
MFSDCIERIKQVLAGVYRLATQGEVLTKIAVHKSRSDSWCRLHNWHCLDLYLLAYVPAVP